MAHTFGRKSFVTGVRDIRAILQYDVKEEYNLYGCEISNFSKEVYKLKSAVRTNIMSVRVQLTL